MFLFKNRMILKEFFVAIFLVLLSSCGEHFFPEFKVKNSDISTGKVIVEFSAPANASSIKENFYFAQDESTVNGNFSFAKNIVIFEPINPIEENHCYEVVVNAGAEDIDGNSLEREYRRKFYTKDDLSRPTVLKTENVLNSENETASLKIQFNKKMNQVSFSENFSIEPSASFITKWNEASDCVEVIFENALDEKTFYAIKIDTGAKDILNNFFAKKFIWSFENIPGYVSPEFTVSVFNHNTKTYDLISDVAECVDFSKEIEIHFNKKFDADKFSANISVEPQINYEISPTLATNANDSDCVKIKFTDAPLWNKTYRLFVSKNLKDAYGTPVEEKSFLLKNNSEKLRPPTLEFILINANKKYETLSKQNNFRDLVIDSNLYQPEVEYNLPLLFFFRISDESETITEISAMEAISVSPQNSCAKITFKNVNICSYKEMFNNDNAALLECASSAVKSLGLENANLVCIEFNTVFYNNESGKSITQGLIDFKVAKTLCDDNKNYMEEAAQLSCNKM